jgi:hemin uptake protein HemP
MSGLAASMPDEPTRPDTAPSTRAPEGGAGAGARSTTPRTVSSSELFGGDDLLRIEHHGQVYILRVTRNDRLILTK